MSSLGIFDKETKTYKKVADLSKPAVIDSSMSDTSTNAVQNKVVKSYVDTRTTLDTAMSDSSTKAVQNKVVKKYVDDRTTLDTSMSDSSTKAVQNKVVKSYVDRRTTFDSSMSDSSTNAVQNNVVKSYVDTRTTFDSSMSDTSNNAVQNKVVKSYVDTHTALDTAMSDASTKAVQNKVVKKYIDDGVNSAKKLQTYKQGSKTETYGDDYPVYAQWRDSTHLRIKCDDYPVETDYATSAGSANSVAWNNVTGKPSTYTPSSHTHTKSQITDFPSSLPANGGNASTVNGHTVNSNVPANAKFTDTTYSDATTSAHGLMTPAMVSKLNGIADGANRTTVDTGMSDTSTNPVQNKAVKSYVDGRTTLDTAMSDTSTKAVQNKVVKSYVDRRTTFDTAMSDTSTNAVQNKVVKSYVDGRTTLDTSMSDSSTKAVQNKVIKSYVDGTFKRKSLAVVHADGKTGYCQLCTIKINQAYVDTPIEITVQERSRTTLDRLTVLFEVVDNNDPNLASFKVFGEFNDWYISKRAASTWVIYGSKSGPWAHIKVVDYSEIDGVNVTWDVTGVTALPDSKTKAAWGGNVRHAVSADRANSASTVNGHTVNSDVPSGAKFTDTTYNDATTSAHGLMTPAMVSKLNGIAEGANRTTVDTGMSDTSTNPVQNKAVKSYVDNGLNTLKKSVSDGKTTVANAITAKGVTTATDATFATMANNISKITTGVDTSDATATAAQILTGHTAYVKGSKVTGTMANRGAVSQALNAGGSYTIPAGYHNGSGKVTANSLASQTSATATADQILYGKTAYVSGSKITGTMPNRGTQTASLNCGDSYFIPEGYHNGSGKVTANSLASQTSANATAANILSGKTAYVNGSKVTGTMTNRGAETASLNCGDTYFIPGGYHNGSGKVTAKSLYSQTTSTATADQILSGQTAWVNGTKITGTLGTRTTNFTRSTATSLNASRDELAGASVGNYALFAGGYRSGSISTVDAYNSSLTRYSPSSLSTARYNLAGASVGNYALFAGGCVGNSGYSSVVDAYNSSLVRSTPTGLSISRGLLAGASVGNYALFAGGEANSSYSSVVDAYNSSLVRSTPDLLTNSRDGLAGASVGNYALFAGGYNGNKRFTTVDAYNSSLVRSKAALSTGRNNLAGASVGNYALFAGGYSTTFSSAVDAYNSSLVRSMPTGLSISRGSLAGASVGNYALFAGGYVGNSSYSSVVDAYNSSLVRSTETSLNASRGSLASASVGNYALFAGGYVGNNSFSSRVDAYEQPYVTIPSKKIYV